MEITSNKEKCSRVSEKKGEGAVKGDRAKKEERR